MDNLTRKDMQEATRTIASMIDRSEKAKEKFERGTSQHTLQRNRIYALSVVSALIEKEIGLNDGLGDFTEEALRKSLDPIASLISKSEKSQKKLKQGTWQHTMLENNLKALYIASQLLTNAVNEMNTVKEHIE